MAEVLHFADEHRQALEPFLPKPRKAAANDSLSHISEPHVTLTYACSLDAMVAAAPGTRTALSGAESKSMTHYLRARHDAILVGYGTAKADDPTLNSRIDGATSEMQPRPIILDGSGSWRPEFSARILQAARDGRGKPPWVVTCSSDEVEEQRLQGQVTYLRMSKADMTWPAMLKRLASQGIQSLMIEGGAHIIGALLKNHLDLIDSLIVTVAPVYLGDEGVRVSSSPINASRLGKVRWLPLGRDAVMCATAQAEKA